MKTLILPDVHCEWEPCEKTIKHEAPDRIIFLGDYFDSFTDNPQIVSDTSDWLKWSLHQPNRTHLFGNHDVQYALPFDFIRVSGYGQWKKFQIDSFMTANDWDLLKYHYILDNTWLLTHAGLHTNHIPNDILYKSDNRTEFYNSIDIYLLEIESKINSDLSSKGISPIFMVGYSRGGFSKYGSILWCDWNKEFMLTRGLNQIFGHTPNVSPQFKILNNVDSKQAVREYDEIDINKSMVDDTKYSVNLCLDTRSKGFYAIWENDKLDIRSKSSICK